MKEKSDFQTPYDITVDEDLTYTFITVGGIKYIAYFICCSNYDSRLTQTFMFNFEHEGDNIKRITDIRIRATIIHIIESFFQNNQNSMIYICDSLDGRELCRKRLFDKWYDEYKERLNYIQREDISEKGESYSLCASLLVHENNPTRLDIIQSFLELKNLLLG